MANQSVENVKGLLQNKSTRVVVVLTFGIVIGTVIYANMATSNQQSRPSGLGPAAVVAPTAPSIKPVPGTSTSVKHNESVREENKLDADRAQQTGQSVIPRLTNNSGDKEKDPFDLAVPKAATPKTSDVTVPVPAAPANAPAPVAAPSPQPSIPQPVVAQPVQKAPGVAEAEKEMSKAMIGLLNSWTPVPQQIEVVYANKGDRSEQQGAGGARSVPSVAGQPMSMEVSNMPAVNAAPVSAGGQGQAKKVAIKAGSILHAVVITSVNSDQPGPVLAQITTGPYAGGRLIGRFDLPKDSEKMILNFSTLTMQNAERSYALSGVAIDPETARTALGSDVDHHYFSRYGMFAAATFLKGYSQALTQQGTQQTATTGPGGVSVTTTYPTLSTKEIAISALGAVGSEVAGSLKDGLKRPPTVTLNSGTEIGVLVMQDTSF